MCVCVLSVWVCASYYDEDGGNDETVDGGKKWSVLERMWRWWWRGKVKSEEEEKEGARRGWLNDASVRWWRMSWWLPWMFCLYFRWLQWQTNRMLCKCRRCRFFSRNNLFAQLRFGFYTAQTFTLDRAFGDVLTGWCVHPKPQSHLPYEGLYIYSNSPGEGPCVCVCVCVCVCRPFYSIGGEANDWQYRPLLVRVWTHEMKRWTKTGKMNEGIRKKQRQTNGTEE